MSDKLEKCVCGGEGRYNRTHFCDKEGKTYYISSCRACFSATPLYTSEEEAVTAWQIMQRALKAGWTSEVPTEEGHYMCAHLRRMRGKIVYHITGHIEIKKENGRLYTEEYQTYVKEFGDFSHEITELKKRFLDEKPLLCGYMFFNLYVSTLPDFIPPKADGHA